jgi:hypothetical protein
MLFREDSMNSFYNQQESATLGRENDLDCRTVQGSSNKRSYISPVLEHQAHLRDITMAPTTGIFESGAGDGRRAKTTKSTTSDGNTDSSYGQIFEENNIFGE